MATTDPVANEQRGEFWTPATPETRIPGPVRFGPPLAGQLILGGEIMPGAGPEPLIGLGDDHRETLPLPTASGRAGTCDSEVAEAVHQEVDRWFG